MCIPYHVINQGTKTEFENDYSSQRPGIEHYFSHVCWLAVTLDFAQHIFTTARTFLWSQFLLHIQKNMEFIIVICEMTTTVWLMILLLLERNCVVTSKLVQTTFRLYENPTGTVNQGGRFCGFC